MSCFYKNLRAFFGKRNVSLGMFFFCIFIQLAFLSSCITKSHIDIVIKNKSNIESLNINVSNVQVVNHQIIITGTNLNNVTKFKIKDGATITDLQIESKSNTSIVANTISNISFTVGTIFDFILSNANAASTFQVTFTNTNNSITAAMFTSMGATKGQVMKYNGTSWVASSITNAQTYLGTWDAITNLPDLTSPSSTPGDYYIVSGPGTFNSISFSAGDWIISDGYNWQKVANSAVVVSTFNGRRGIVTLQPSDYVTLKNGSGKLAGSSLNDIADINIITPVNGSVLKYDTATSKWIVGVDNSGGGSYTGTINKAVVTDGTTGALTTSATTSSEIGFVAGVTSAIQTQLDTKQATSLTSGNILVGSAGNIATSVALSGDATLANTGSITLKNTGTAGTYNTVTTDAQGRVTSGINTTYVTSLSGTAPVTIAGTAVVPVVSMAAATTAANGYLTSANWNTFNNKQDALSAGPTINGIVYPANSAQTLQIPLAPVALTDAVNKQYVDGLTAGAWSANSGNVYRSTGNVGIGTTNPTSKLTVNGDIRAEYISAGNLSLSGSSLANIGVSVYNTGDYESTLSLYSDGYGNTSISSISNTNGTLTIGSDHNLSFNSLNTSFNGGNVGIGSAAPGYLLQVGNAADGSEARANVWNTLSDERLKKDFEIIPASLEKLLSINGYYYHWNRGSDTAKKMGVKAQEVEKVFPEVISHGEDGFLSVSYNHLVAAVIEAVKEFYYKWGDDSKSLHREIASVKEQNKMKDKEIQKLKSDNESIKAYLCLKDPKAPICR
jgi:hypothetical protein